MSAQALFEVLFAPSAASVPVPLLQKDLIHLHLYSPALYQGNEERGKSCEDFSACACPAVVEDGVMQQAGCK